MHPYPGFMALVTWVKFLGEKLKATIPLEPQRRYKSEWWSTKHERVFRTMGRIKVAKTKLIRIWCFGSFVPIHNFPPCTGSWWIGTRESPRYKPHFLKINPTVGVPSTFGLAIFIFQVPKRYAYLSCTGKLKCIDLNFTKSGTLTCLLQMIKWKQEFLNWISGGQDLNFWND